MLDQSSFLKQQRLHQGDSYLGSSRVPTYSLHSAYEKFVVLPTSGPGQKTNSVVPRYSRTTCLVLPSRIADIFQT